MSDKTNSRGKPSSKGTGSSNIAEQARKGMTMLMILIYYLAMIKRGKK